MDGSFWERPAVIILSGGEKLGNENIERAMHIYSLLDKNYPREISFLQYNNSFELMICVILSAQTTDRQVMQVAPRLFGIYPDAGSLACADLDTIRDIIKPVGFYRVKAENIRKAAAALLDRFSGAVPDNIEDLITIPGIGRKSANVLVGALYGKPAVIVDTHFSRVVRRLGLSAEKDPGKIEAEISGIIDSSFSYRFSMTVNLHGRKICHARKPLCAECFLEKLCPGAARPDI